MLVLVPTLLLPGVGMVWPLIETCRVLTTTAPVHDDDNDEQDERRSSPLCYWIVFLVGRLLLERPLDACLGGGAACQWFKVALLLWLVMPPRRFHGAGVIVRHVLQPLLSAHDATIDEHLAAASTKARATARAVMAEIGRALASTCLPAVIARQLQPSTQQQGGNSGSGSDNLSTALAFVEMARAFLAPLLAKDEAAAE